MKDLIKSIIHEIPTGLVFDSHAVIFKLIQDYSDEYLANFSGGSTESYHGNIGRKIASLEKDSSVGIVKIGESWSKNIRDKFSKCTCWRKL